MNKLISLLLSASILSLSACASIIQGGADKVSINAVGNQSATCQVKNGRGEYTIVAPGNVEVKRSKTDLDISCTSDQTGATGKKTVESDLEPWVLGNILLGGIIGLGVDFGTGSAWNYPAQVDVNIPAPQAQTYAPPANAQIAPATPVAVQTPAQQQQNTAPAVR